MAFFDIAGAQLDLPRNLMLLDTNILVALADPEDNLHLEVSSFLEESGDWVLGVAPPVIVEACGFLIGKRKKADRAAYLLRWLLSPGGALLLPAPHSPNNLEDFLLADMNWMGRYKIDYVDAFLMQMANIITTACSFKPNIIIATTDLRDFIRCFGKGYLFRIYNVESSEILDL